MLHAVLPRILLLLFYPVNQRKERICVNNSEYLLLHSPYFRLQNLGGYCGIP